MKRILFVFNLLVGVAALAAALAVLWWVWRPGVASTGRLAAPVSAAVVIERDGLGVPHIRGATIEDVLFGQGFATAEDRMWQMDSLRRLAAGELSEIAGKAALEMDLKSRQLRMKRIAERWAGLLPDAQRRRLAAYARGVNHYIETRSGKLPPEFTLLGYAPRPWTVADSLLCALQMNRTLSGNWENDLLKSKMAAAGDRALVEQLFPARIGDEPLPGSNAWVLSGRRTSTGKPVLANDPHLPWTMPATWHMVHLKGPGLDAAGAALPGVPAVVIGHNERIAWGITALQFDNMDLYVEKIDPRTGRYEYAGRQMQAEREVERIAIKGAAPMDVAVWVTVHGPVVVQEEGRVMALKWGAAFEDAAEFPVLEWNQARNWEEFRAALRRLPGPNINVLYADVDGNIGWQVAGRLPVREGFDGSEPLDGASGLQEWKGFVVFDQLPSSFNPSEGVLVSANHNPFPGKTPFTVSGFFSSPDRAKQIRARLLARLRWAPGEMLGVQKDVYSALLDFIAKSATVAVERRGEKNPMAVEGAALLKGWNGQMAAAKAAPFLASLLYEHLRRAIAERACPKYGASYKSFMAPGVVARILRERNPAWFDDFDLLLANQLADAVEEGKRMQGRDPARWRYGRQSRVTLVHQVLGRLPWAGRYFNLGPAEMDGSATAVNAVTEIYGPSMRFVADTKDFDASLMNVTAGESAHIFSGHYRDQWDAYLQGRSFRLGFRRVEARQQVRLEPGAE